MVKSVGLDIVEVDRIKKDIDKFGDNFVKRILSSQELELYHKRVDKAQYLAGRFAAKEAIIKGLGVYLSERPPYVEIQVINNLSGQPELELNNSILDLKKNNINCFISITHEKKYAAAVAVFTEVK